MDGWHDAEVLSALMVPRWPIVLRDAALIVLLCGIVALSVNSTRSMGAIPLVAKKDYEILVPCPELTGRPAQPLRPDQLDPSRRGQLLIDARGTEQYRRWHAPGAISIPYDYLEPNPEEKRVLRTHARQVVVYGDGQQPDSGQQLANAISGKGVKNVYFVKGGAPALRRRLDR